MNIGRIQDLIVLRQTSEGLILGDDAGTEVLLPQGEPASEHGVGSSLRVFMHRERDGRLLASTQLPKAEEGHFAQMQVSAIRGAGALVDWGMEPHLLVPHEEQKKPLEEGRWYVVRVALDKTSGTLYGSTRIEHFLSNDHMSMQRGDAVELMIFGRSELGYSVVVNNLHQGLIHATDVFRTISIGDRLPGYVKQVREDNKLDIVLQPIGYRQYIDAHTELLAKRLQTRAFLPLTDKSSAEEIHAEFGISKKAFKKALGALYKERLVRIGEEGIVWVG